MPKADYDTDDHFALELPIPPAVMVGEDIPVEGSACAEYDMEKAVCAHPGLPVPPEPEKKGFFQRLRGA